jgi:hypothetical protein
MSETSDVPVDRLTRICAAMSAAMDAHPETREGDKAIMFIDDAEHGGIVLHGYGPDQMNEAIGDLFIHLQAMLHSVGKGMDIIAIPDDVRDLDGG